MRTPQPVAVAAADPLPAATRKAIEDYRARPTGPYLWDCTTAERGNACLGYQARFVVTDWAAAHHGDLEAAKFVSWCLSASCGGAVEPQPVEGCAWGLYTLTSGTKGGSDTAAQACERLSSYDLAAAKARALDLAEQLPALRAART